MRLYKNENLIQLDVELNYYDRKTNGFSEKEEEI